MSSMTRFKIGLVAMLWAIIAVAAASGWLIGHGNASRQISQLKQQLAVSAAPRPACGMDIQLLEVRDAETSRAPNVFGLTLAGIWPSAPQHLNLGEMLMRR